MADDLDAQLSELEDKAPLTIEGEAEDVTDYGPGNPKPEDADVGAKPEDKDAGKADEWKPPTKDHWENLEKARRADREALRAERQQKLLYEQNIQRMQERFEQFQAQQMAQRLQQPGPDPYEHPEAARQWQEQQRQFQLQLLQAEQQRQQQIRAAEQQERDFQHVSSAVEDYETEFKATNPDYDDATDHMLGIQQKLLEGMGYPPHVAHEQVAIWSVNVARQAIQSGRNPAQVAYDLAKQMGYVRKGEGVEAAAQKLANIKAGQASAQTLSGGGAPARGSVSLKQIASLEGAAFDSAMEKYLNDSIRGR